jgi:signal transduction histidine kinase
LTAERRFDLGVAVFVAACLAVMFVHPAWQTVPFHWIWISLTLLAGVRLWPVRSTWAIVVALASATAAAMVMPGGPGAESLAELSEIPLMATVYLTMVWHARRRELALQRVDRAIAVQRDFVRDAAHGLRTPLTIARGHLELADGELPAGGARDDVRVALDELCRLSAMSDSLLLLTTAEDPTFLAMATVDAGALVADVAARWQAATGRAIAVDPSGGALLVRGDDERLRCALDALIENALRATEDGGEITVAARPDGEAVVIEVRDSGRGVPAWAQGKVFDRFYRVDVESVRRGSGLGLAVVKAIAEAHGGSLSLRSRPGDTVFALRVPAAPVPATAPGVDRTPAAARAAALGRQ